MKNETKHTPGPWRERWIRPNKEKGHTFDPTCWIEGDTPEYGSVRLADIADPIDEEAEANARLIAAAPEMLEALKRIAGGNVMADFKGKRPYTHADTVVEYQEICRAAIAKAEGEDDEQ